MQTIEFETYISDNCINIPLNYYQLNNHRAKIVVQFSDLSEKGNFNKAALVSAFEKAKLKNIFKNIENSVLWQQEIRDEWE